MKREQIYRPQLSEIFTNVTRVTVLTLGAVLLSASSALSQQTKKDLSCEELNGLIQALPAAGGTINIPEGTLTCQSPIIIDRDNVTLKGAGTDKTIIRAADGVALPLLVIGSVKHVIATAETTRPGFEIGVPYPDRVTSNVRVFNLTIDGNYHSHPDPGSFECWNTLTKKTQTCDGDTGTSIRNNGITVRRTENIHIANVVTKANYSGGITLEKHNRNILIENFIATDNWWDGFAGYLTEDSVFRNFRVSENRAAGISIDGDFTKNLLQDIEVSNNGTYGVFSNEIGGNVFDRVRVFGNKDQGFFFDGIVDQRGDLVPHSCDNNTISNSIIEDNGRAGILVPFPCKNLKLSNVVIHQKTGECTDLKPGVEIDYDNYTCKVDEQ